MSVMIMDAGNSIIKAKIARREMGELAFPHALQPLTENEYTTILSRAGKTTPLPDYLRVNGKPYVIGESAERHGLVSQRNGASRYTRDYYGVLAAAALGCLYERGQQVKLFGSHPPGDVRFRQDLMQVVIGDWIVEVGGSELKFKVTYANTFDEPVGGLMNVLLTEDGQHYQRTDLNGGRALVIDIGGFTTDWIAVNPGGEVDYSLARSVPLGVQSVLADFEESFKANNLKAVKDTPVLPPERVRKAIISGYFEGGGHIGRPLKVMGEAAGFEVIVVDVEPGRTDIPELATVHLTADSYVVLITTDHVSDEAAPRQVINSPVRYIGMIGSRAKCGAILDHLKTDGVTPEVLQCVYAPIGLDLGGPSPEEIAVAILAEAIAVRHGGKGVSRSR